MSGAPRHGIDHACLPRMWRVLAGTGALALAGCVNMSGLGGGSKYACAAPEGVACDSVSGTYANAVRNRLPGQRHAPEAPDQATGTAMPPEQRPSPGREMPFPAAASGQADAQPSDTAAWALRSGPRVLRLWTKAWEDADGDLWDQGYVYVQVSSGQWDIEHVQQRARDRYAPLRPPSVQPTGPTTAPSAPEVPPQMPSVAPAQLPTATLPGTRPDTSTP